MLSLRDEIRLRAEALIKLVSACGGFILGTIRLGQDALVAELKVS